MTSQLYIVPTQRCTAHINSISADDVRTSQKTQTALARGFDTSLHTCTRCTVAKGYRLLAFTFDLLLFPTLEKPPPAQHHQFRQTIHQSKPPPKRVSHAALPSKLPEDAGAASAN